MATAKKLPSGNYRVQAKVTIGGKSVVKSFTNSDKNVAELKAKEWQTQIFRLYDDTTDITLSEAIDRYIAERKNVVSPSTIATYEKIKRNYFIELQKKKLSKITRNSMQIAVNDLASNLSAKTVKSAYGLISSAIKNVTGETLQIKLPQRQKLIYNTPDAKTAKQIITAVTGTPIELPVKLAIRLGLRMSEIRGLKWSAVHDDFIVIDNVIVTVDNEPVEKQPKSTAGFRKIPLPKDLKKLINEQPHINDYIIQETEKSIGARFRRILKNNNIPHCRFHDLRHANASAMALLGIPDKYAMKVGGWDTPEVLKNIYQQTFTDDEIKFAKKIDKYFQ